MRFLQMMSLALGLVLMVSFVFASEFDALYREGKYDQIITMLSKMDDQIHNEDSLYYLALSYTKKRKYEEAVKTLNQLLQRDPCFYSYRIKYDFDFNVLFERGKHKLSFSCPGGLVTKQPISGHQLVLLNSGLYFYRNGVRQFLTDNTFVSKMGFVNDDVVYYYSQKEKKGRHAISKKMFYVYSGKEKRLLKAVTLKGDLSHVNTDQPGQIVVYTSKGTEVVSFP